jgi:tRNA pseudouridine65 synthase
VVHRDRHGNPCVRGPEDVGAVTVLWRDATAAALDKPSGLLAHNAAFAGPSEWTLVQAATALLGMAPALLHRLDRGTSGVVLVATDRQHTAAWQGALDQATKQYLGLVRGVPRGILEIDHPVTDASGEKRAAQTTLEPLLTSMTHHCSLVRLTLHTGRWRQARQHCKHVSHPLLGDAEYGKGPLNRQFRDQHGLDRLALHASTVRLQHPLDGGALVLHAAWPAALQAVTLRLFAQDELAAALRHGM